MPWVNTTPSRSASRKSASSNVQRSKRASPGRTRRRSAPSKRQSRKIDAGRAENIPWYRLSKRTARKSQVIKRQPASEKRSKRAFRKSTDRSVARLIATMLSGGASGAGSLWAAVPLSAAGAGSTPPGGGSLGSLAGRDTAPWGELAGMRALRRLVRIGLLAVLDKDLVDLGH